MHHIPRPANSPIPHLEVPFLQQVPFELDLPGNSPSQDGFDQAPMSYPGREPDIPNFDCNREVLDYARSAQSKLYFGLLSEYCSKEVNRLDFLYVTPEKRRVVTSVKCMEQTRRPTSQKEWVTKETYYNNWDDPRLKALRNVEAVFGKYSRLPCAGEYPLSVILLSVNVLIDSLSPCDIFLKPHLVPANFLASRLRALGWCPQQSRYICDNLPAQAAYFVSLLRRRGRDGVEHSLYSESKRLANVSQESAYETRHVTRACRCNMVGVDQNEVSNIIMRGRIPLMSLEYDNHPHLRLKVKATEVRNEYVAISHIWADGLGNPCSNALPRCQIERIGKRISILPKTGQLGTSFNTKFGADFVHTSSSEGPSRSFWLDTLCIPVGDENQDVRLTAINTMAAVYSGASHILIMDRELQQLRLGSQPYLDHLAFIACCTWVTRCWTFQEGALPRHCYL